MSRLLGLCSACLILALLPVLALAAPELLQADPPAWVEDAPLPGIDPDLVRYASDGVYWLLSDDQVSWEGETRLTHSRLAMKVLNRAGLEFAASVQRDFDPASETLTMIRLDILRDGKRIPVRDRVQPEFLRREPALADGLIDGMTTVLLEVPDLRVGDVLDAAFLWTSRPLFEGQTFSGAFSHEYSEPVGLSRLVLNWPAQRHFATSALGGGVRLSERVKGAVRRIEMTHAAHVPIAPEDDLPPEVDPWNAVLYSAAIGWNDITDALQSHYAPTHPVPAGWVDAVEAISDANTTETERAFAALRLVQDRVRYVGVEIGPGGYFARDPEIVVAKGYGDCKDKSVLLVTLLRALGIEADVALTDLDQGYGLGQIIPMAGVFDHMIVRAVVDGAPIWMDATGSQEGGGAVGAVQPDYGYGLPITGRFAGQMLPIAPDPDNTGLLQVSETFRFQRGELLLDVVTEATGAAADNMRWIWSTTALDEIETHYRDYYAGSYPGLELRAPVRMEDARSVNRLRITEAYRLPATALADNVLTDDFPFVADGFDDVLPEPDDGPRTAPFYIDAPYERVHHVLVENLPAAIEPGESVTVTSKAFSYSFHSSIGTNGTLALDWHFRPLARAVKPEDIADYADARGRMLDSIRQSRNLTAPQSAIGRFFNALRTKAAERAAEPAAP